MSDEDSSEDKTEFVSARRQQQAWDEGRIPVGREVAGVVALAGGLACVLALAPRIQDALVALTRESLASADRPLSEVGRFVMLPVGLTLVVIAVAALLATAATVAQTRGGLWPELAMPDFERMSGNKLFHAFSREFLVDLGVTLLKVAIILAVAWRVCREDLSAIHRLLMLPPAAQLAGVFSPLVRLSVSILAVMVVFAGVDLALAHFRFREKLKMTKEEAKREAKEDEGDPMMKSRRKRKARELMKNRIAVEVPKADAIIVNPTHIAIAIRYRKDEGSVPRVIAKGKDQVAENIRELARSHGIPIVEDIMLARLLFKKVKVGKAIPAETYKAVAAILAFVYRITGRSGRKAAA